MKTNESSPPRTFAGDRPIGIWVVTIWAGLSGGLLSVVVAWRLLTSEEGGGPVGRILPLLIGLLGMTVLFFSFGAWRGWGKSRYALAILMVLQGALLASVVHQRWKAAPRDGGPSPWRRMARPIVFGLGIAGYLMTSHRAREFFRRGPQARPKDESLDPKVGNAEP